MSTPPSGSPPATPVIGAPLPAADKAYIDPDKLRRYALDPESDVGRHKATVFERALGIELRDLEHLKTSVELALPSCPVYVERKPQHEHDMSTWGVLVPVQGLREQAERRLLVVTAWKMVDGRPVLATIRVGDKRVQREASGD